MSAAEPATKTTIVTSDGVPLAADFVAAEAPRATVVVGSATGVPRRFYVPFARFLVERGLATLVFDYRGIGDSRPKRRRGFAASMHEWGEKDLDAALSFAERAVPGVPRLYVGHSVGAQVLALAAASDRLHAALFVAGQSGYWRHWHGARRMLMGSLWFAIIPAFATAFGLLPMKPAGGEDLPRGVALEWARWGRDPRYVLSYPGAADALARLSLPIRDYAIADDHYAPRPAIEALLSYYARATTEIRDVTPAEAGAAKIGHFGFFREKFRATLWNDAREWLLARTVA